MGENTSEEESLGQLFDRGLNIHGEVLESHDDTNSLQFQDKVKKGILILEDATRLVSLLDVFSRNENFSELPMARIFLLKGIEFSEPPIH